MQMWRVTQGVCRTDGAEGCPVYGVQVALPDAHVCWVLLAGEMGASQASCYRRAT